MEAGGGTQGGEAAESLPYPRRQDKRQERQEATESGAETEAEEDEGNNEEGDRDGYTPRGAPLEVVRVGGGGQVPPHEDHL